MTSAYSFDMLTGNDKILQITLRDEDGSPHDLNGHTIGFVVRLTRAGANLISKSIGSGITVTDEAGGVFRITLSDTDTDAFNDGVYYYEVKVTTDTLVEVSVLDGKIRMRKSLFTP